MLMLGDPRSNRTVLGAVVLSFCLMGTGLTQAPPVHAGTEQDAGQASREAGIGVATVFANLLYIPVKVGYAALGGITGGGAYLVTGGNRDVADRIWVPSLGGDYVLSPAHMSRDETIHFSGLRELPGESGAPQASMEPELTEEAAYDAVDSGAEGAGESEPNGGDTYDNGF